MTLAVNKQLMPLFNKPLIYYPLSTLLDCGIKDLLVITTPPAEPEFKKLLGDGAQWGVTIDYALQPSPAGIAQALTIGAEFLHGDPAALILGDNLFIAPEVTAAVRSLPASFSGALSFACRVQDPERYGVVAFAPDGSVSSIEEKPAQPKSSFALTGLYCFDGSAPQRAAQLKPSARGELEITDLHLSYLQDGLLQVYKMQRGSVWLDTGTPNALLDAADYIRIIETRQGILVGSPEISAFRQGFILQAELEALAAPLLKTQYGQYLYDLARDPDAAARFAEWQP